LLLTTDFGNANSSTHGRLCAKAGDVVASGAGNADFVVIQTNLSHGLQRTHDSRAPHTINVSFLNLGLLREKFF
jgi:hypothetical protein